MALKFAIRKNDERFIGMGHLIGNTPLLAVHFKFETAFVSFTRRPSI